MSRTVLLVLHNRRVEAAERATQMVKTLREHGISAVAETEDWSRMPEGLQALVRRVDSPAGLPDLELALVLGGDGTFLRAAELTRGTGAPLLGINFGHVGFLAEAEEGADEHIAELVVARDYTIEERLALDVEASLHGEVFYRTWALNEATVEKAARERMLVLTAEIDGRPVSTWGCDGVVVATPTGSTAYAFSAGGPIVWPRVEALLLVPISAHALFSRSMVVSTHSALAIEVVDTGEATGVLWCDGRRSIELPPGARVDARASQTPVPLARLTESPFTDRLVAKFELPVSGWRGDRRA